MKIECSLTTGNYLKANLLLTFYYSFKPILLFLLIFTGYTLYTGKIAAFFFGVPLGLACGIVISLIIGLVLARRNRHCAGERTLVMTKESYRYTGEFFAREKKWSEQMDNWFTPWYIFLDVKSPYPVLIRRDTLSEDRISQLHELFSN